MSVVQAFYNNNNTGTASAGTPFQHSSRSRRQRKLYDREHVVEPDRPVVEPGRRLVRVGRLQLHGPDGTHTTPGGQFTPNPDYWTFEPTFAVAYLANNWVLAANFFYDINSKSAGHCCASSLAFLVDRSRSPAATPCTATSPQPTSSASGNRPGWLLRSADHCRHRPGCAIGLLRQLVERRSRWPGGYDFGPVDLQVWVTDSVARANAIDGLDTLDALGLQALGSGSAEASRGEELKTS